MSVIIALVVAVLYMHTAVASGSWGGAERQ